MERRQTPKTQPPTADSRQGLSRNSCRQPRQASEKAEPEAQSQERCMNRAGARRAPGSEAPALSLPALWNSIPRSCSGPFASYLRAALCRKTKAFPTPYTWPCPMAFGNNSEGLWRKRLISLSVARLSFEHMDCPSSCPASVRLGVPLNRKQWQIVRNLEHLVYGSFFPLTFQPEDYGRIGHSHAKTLEALSRAAASVCRSFAGYLPRSATVAAPGPPPVLKVGTLAGKPDIAAMPIVADRVKLPASPAFSPAPYMDRTTAELLTDLGFPTPLLRGLPS